MFNKIYIEITNYCNLNCSFCSKNNHINHEMSIDEFKLVIDKIKDYTNNIYLHIKGEPLLHSKLDELLNITDNTNLNVRITTNGTLLDKKIDILLKHRIKQINVSLHCENNYNNYFFNVFNNCDKLINTAIIYRIWTLKELDKLPESVNKIIEHYNLNNDIINKIKNDKNIKIGDNIYIDKDYEFEWPIYKDNKDDYGTCLGTRTHIGILSNGTIVPCCLDTKGSIELGNIYKDSLDDIINSKLFKDINNGFKNHKLVCDLCKSCSFRKRFK